MSQPASFDFLNSVPACSNFPLYVFWKDKNFRYQGGNPQFLKAVGLNENDGLAGKTDHDMPWASQTTHYTNSDLLVLEGKSALSKGFRWHVEGSRYMIINKLPIRDEKDKIIGILGIHQDATEYVELDDTKQGSLIEPIQHIPPQNELELLSTLKSLLNNLLTYREIQCLSLWVSGYSIKASSSCLKLSPKSIEAYRKNIKDKMMVFHRHQLIDLLREKGNFHLLLTFGKLIEEKSKKHPL